MSDAKPRPSISKADFLFGELRPEHKIPPPSAPPPPLGPLAAFVGDWVGNGFNTIFRPDNNVTPTSTTLPHPLPPGDNILELNLTSETLSFSKSLGSVPNRGTTPQRDLFLNGVPYLQTINDITVHGERVGIHFEPGIWIHVPATDVPSLRETVTRMASIPHGTTIEAQGIFTSIAGPPTIAPLDITPFLTGSKPPTLIKFPSQTAADSNTARIPQDLTSFIAAGTITQTLLDDPNSLLRAHISKQNIVNTIAIVISTAPPPPLAPPPPPGLFGGGTDNIAFLLGQPTAPGVLPPAPNAQALQMTAVFWIETVEEKILVPPYRVGMPPFAIRAKASVPGQRVATFSVTPPFDLEMPREITVTFTQIQYTQTVLLNFNNLTWPHVSVNTLVPAEDIVVPPSVWK